MEVGVRCAAEASSVWFTESDALRHLGLPQIIQRREYGQMLAKQYSDTKIVGYTPQQVFDVVANVPEYHHFLPWCVGSRKVRTFDETTFDAELTIGFQLFKEQFTSRVHLRPASSPGGACQVTSRVGDTLLFTHLDSTWVFVKGPADDTCLIKFNVDFDFKSSLYRQVANMFFDEVVKKMMDAFVSRCEQKYGESSLPARLQQGKRAHVQPFKVEQFHNAAGKLEQCRRQVMQPLVQPQQKAHVAQQQPMASEGLRLGSQVKQGKPPGAQHTQAQQKKAVQQQKPQHQTQGLKPPLQPPLQPQQAMQQPRQVMRS